MPPIADITQRDFHVRLVPVADMRGLTTGVNLDRFNEPNEEGGQEYNFSADSSA